MRVFLGLLSTAALALCLAGNALAADDSSGHWETNLENAQKIAAQTNRLILVHCWAPWCGPCMRLQREIFSHAETARSLEANFVLVKLNVDEAPGTAQNYGISRLPSDIILSPAGRLITTMDSPRTMAQYIATMNQIAGTANASAHGATAVATDTRPAAGPNGPGREIVPVQGYADERATANYNRPPADPAQLALAAASQQPFDRAAPPQPGFPPGNGAPNAGQQASLNQNPVMPSQPGLRLPGHEIQDSAPAPAATSLKLPPGSPPLAMEGYCPVTLVERKKWSLGDARYGVIHRNHTYLFTGPEEQKQFLSHPDAYAPIMSGIDPVLALDARQTVPGRREFGAYYGNRVVLFNSQQSLEQFSRNPSRYAAEALQAMR